MENSAGMFLWVWLFGATLVGAAYSLVTTPSAGSTTLGSRADGVR